jgi:hypothetical protein
VSLLLLIACAAALFVNHRRPLSAEPAAAPAAEAPEAPEETAAPAEDAPAEEAPEAPEAPEPRRDGGQALQS